MVRTVFYWIIWRQITKVGQILNCFLNQLNGFILIPGVPPPPSSINDKKTGTIGCDMNLTWTPPVDHGCPLTMYSIYYRHIPPRGKEAPWNSVNISDVLQTHYVLSLRCDLKYGIEISAWNELGQGDRSRTLKIKPVRPGRFLRVHKILQLRYP